MTAHFAVQLVDLYSGAGGFACVWATIRRRDILNEAPNVGKMAETHELSGLCLSVVVPAYNEEPTLANVVRKLLKLDMLLEVIIVDDCSSDRTPEICAELSRLDPRVSYIRHPANKGKTEALKTGFAITTGAIVIVQDADLEYDPEEIPAVISPIILGHADVVYGSRFLVRKAARVLYYYHFVANRGLTILSNLFTNINLTDVETGYKAFRGDIIRNMIITSSGFGFEIEVTAKVAKLGCIIYEVPISYYGRTYEQGKKIGFTDGLQALWLIVRYNLFCSRESSFRALPSIAEAAG
jgi:glycosyltransferase involved in cell wall biosynthesis